MYLLSVDLSECGLQRWCHPDNPWSKLQKQHTQRTSQLKKYWVIGTKAAVWWLTTFVWLFPSLQVSYLTIHDILTASRIVPISHKTAKWVVLKKLYHLCLKFSFIWKGYCWICKKSYFCNLSLKYQGQNWNVDTGASSYTIWNSDMGISIIRFFSHDRGQSNLILKLSLSLLLTFMLFQTSK